MTRRLLIGCLLALAVLCAATARAGADDNDSFTLAVQQSRLWGSNAGSLHIDADGIAFEAAAPKHSRRWRYEDVDQLQVRSPRQLAVITYEGRGRMRLGGHRVVEFEVRDAEITPRLVAFLLSRSQRPVVTAVLPPVGETSIAAVLVTHERYRDNANGTLSIYGNALAFKTARPGDTRYWRDADIFSVLSLGPYQLEVTVYEGGGDEIRPFTFSLRSPLSDAAFRALWSRVNRPLPYGARGSAEPSTSPSSPALDNVHDRTGS